MPNRKTPQRILWALDPFEKESETRAHVSVILKEFTEANQAEIEPVYVLNPGEFELSEEFTSPWLKQYKPTAEKTMTQCLKDFQIPGILPPHIVVERRPSKKRMLQALLGYAKRSGADMIALGTHARKGFSRLILGSFAESLLLYSKLPLLIVGAQPPARKLEHILFATDFEKGADTLFKKVLKLAKDFGARITLLHVIHHPIEPVIQTGVYLLSGGWISLPDYLTREEAKKQKIADRYAEIAARHGISLNIAIEFSQVGISRTILQNAKDKGANLIAIAAESSPVASVILGSVTRQAVREAPCPIWVMRCG
jgi:nucleotide-binding universal stress UspA family protein